MQPTFNRLLLSSPLGKPSSQTGGTLLGLIVGVIIGLAIALVAAVYIAKLPIPFVSNSQISNIEQNAQDDQKNQSWNPNSSLASRAPKGGASSTDERLSNNNSTNVPTPMEVRKTDGSIEVRGTPIFQPAGVSGPGRDTAGGDNSGPTSQDILGEFAAEQNKGPDPGPSPAPTVKPPTRVATASPTTPGVSAFDNSSTPYFVQTGAFHSPDEADAERARLSLQGIQANISQGEQGGGPIYRVRVGPFHNRTAAYQIKDRLTSSGFEAVLVAGP